MLLHLLVEKASDLLHRPSSQAFVTMLVSLDQAVIWIIFMVGYVGCPELLLLQEPVKLNWVVKVSGPFGGGIKEAASTLVTPLHSCVVGPTVASSFLIVTVLSASTCPFTRSLGRTRRGDYVMAENKGTRSGDCGSFSLSL